MLNQGLASSCTSDVSRNPGATFQKYHVHLDQTRIPSLDMMKLKSTWPRPIGIACSKIAGYQLQYDLNSFIDAFRTCTLPLCKGWWVLHGFTMDSPKESTIEDYHHNNGKMKFQDAVTFPQPSFITRLNICHWIRVRSCKCCSSRCTEAETCSWSRLDNLT